MRGWRRLRLAGSRFLLGAVLGTACGALLIWAPSAAALLILVGGLWFVLMRFGNRFS